MNRITSVNSGAPVYNFTLFLCYDWPHNTLSTHLEQWNVKECFLQYQFKNSIRFQFPACTASSSVVSILTSNVSQVLQINAVITSAMN